MAKHGPNQIPVIAALIILVSLTWLFAAKFGAGLIWAALLSLNCATFALFGLDKACAVRGYGRVTEGTLQLFSLLGGSPGGLLGMLAFNHKVSDKKFQRIFWGIVCVQVVALVLFALLSS
jgi:uncharacterized membrane protein YsdA (DUF1294 family)